MKGPDPNTWPPPAWWGWREWKITAYFLVSYDSCNEIRNIFPTSSGANAPQKFAFLNVLSRFQHITCVFETRHLEGSKKWHQMTSYLREYKNAHLTSYFCSFACIVKKIATIGATPNIKLEGSRRPDGGRKPRQVSYTCRNIRNRSSRVDSERWFLPTF